MMDYKDYHGDTKFSDKLVRDGVNSFERSLLSSPDAFIVSVDNEDVNVMIQSTSNYNERRILFKKGDVSWGDLITHEGEKWLVTERPFFNKIHEKSKIQLCSNAMKFIYFTEGYFEEYDRFGNEIWIVEPEEVEIEFPCTLESIVNLSTRTTTGEQINIPKGDMVLQIQYTENELIELNSEFYMFDQKYRISGIDKSKVHEDKGILIIVASRVANNA